MRPAHWLAGLFLPLLAGPALPAGDDLPARLQARNRAASCMTCHGAGPMAPLAGRPQADIVAAVRAFRDGTRESTVMQQIARGYTNAQVAAIAAWLAAEPAPAKP